MKAILKTGVCILLVAICSCQKTELAEDRYFIKSFGEKAGSSMTFISESNEGGYILGGKIGNPAFTGNDINGTVGVKDILKSGPAIIIADDRANSVSQHVYPVEDLELSGTVYVDELGGTGRLLDVRPTPDGGYFAIGEFLGFGYGITSLGINVAPSQGNASPFILYLNSNFQVTDFTSLNAEGTWDEFHHFHTRIKKRPGGGYVMLMGYNVDFNIGRFRGFQLIEMNEYGRNLIHHEYYGGQLRFGSDFDFYPNGDIVVIGQADAADIHVFFIDGKTFSLKSPISMRVVKNDGVFGDSPNISQRAWNNNPMFVFAREDGTISCIITDPNTKSLYVNMDENSNVTYCEDYEPVLEDQFPRSACMADNGDILVINDDLTVKENIHSILYRISPDGQVKWQRAFDGSARYVTNASDGSILVLVDLPFNGVSTFKSTLLKLSPDGNLF